ncbi:MAG: hypothetical protein NWE85_01190 [Candidatus Bathyarchaeota archaeon]|nr:hypothetical protein [Candidatus Bathyarchaeota archaeon]
MAGFTDTPKARREQWKMEQHKTKSALKLQKSNYRLQERIKKDSLKRACSQVTEKRKWEIQEASWGHKHPKR